MNQILPVRTDRELISTFKSGKAHGEEAITATAELLNLTDSQVRTAVRYYGAFPAEIDRRIALNTADADGVEAAWQRGQAALTCNSALTRGSVARSSTNRLDGAVGLPGE